MKRVFIVHGWEGHPEEAWFPWLKKELEQKGYKVEVPAMPNTDEPEINAWVSHLAELVGEPDEETYFVGHSIGCQTILRYLQGKSKVGGIFLVACWVHLTEKAVEEEGAAEIAKPWLEEPIAWDTIKTNKVVAIFSDDDPFVPVEDAKIFEEKLGAKIIVVNGKGHINGTSKVFELPEVLAEFN